jgi:hypothetical protein
MRERESDGALPPSQLSTLRVVGCQAGKLIIATWPDPGCVRLADQRPRLDKPAGDHRERGEAAAINPDRMPRWGWTQNTPRFLRRRAVPVKVVAGAGFEPATFRL